MVTWGTAPSRGIRQKRRQESEVGDLFDEGLVAHLVAVLLERVVGVCLGKWSVGVWREIKRFRWSKKKNANTLEYKTAAKTDKRFSLFTKSPTLVHQELRTGPGNMKD